MPPYCVLQIIPELETGGAERTTVDIAAALVSAGHRALVASAGGRLVAELEALGAEHITLPLATKSPWRIWRNAGTLAQIVEREQVDLLHARSRAPAWSALIAARRTARPFVTTYHGIYKQTNALKGLYNSVMVRGDAVIANSRYTAELIAERHPFARDRLTVIHRGSDLGGLAPQAVSDARRDALRQAWGIAAGTPVILNLARLTGWKGQTVLIEALARLASTTPDAAWTAILAGDDQGRREYSQMLQARIAAAGLADRIRLPGHCGDVAAALALADVSVVASTEPEAFGRAAVEAQAASVPIIATDLGGARETVLAPPDVAEEARTGWRVPAGDASALADALTEVLALDAGTRTDVTARALRHVSARFSREAMCGATLAIYDRLIDNCRAGSKHG